MAARKSECRLPAGMTPDDLGHAVTAADSRCALVSFAYPPVVGGRDNDYVLLMTDAALGAAAASFEWTYAENGQTVRTETTTSACSTHRPTASGELAVSVRVLDAGNNEQAALTLGQGVTMPSVDLEDLIGAAQDTPGPTVGDTETLRELVNQHCRYYQGVTPAVAEAGDAFARLVFSMALDGVSNQSAAARRAHAEDLATALDGGPQQFADAAVGRVGVCGIRLGLLAMVLPNPAAPYLAWEELPEPANEHAVAERELQQRLATLSSDVQSDLFNIARFPKSNIAACGHTLEALRNRYFSGTNFNDILTGQSGTRANTLWSAYRDGPLTKA